MKAAAGWLVVALLAGCASQSQEAIFPPDNSADAAACREEALRDPKLKEMRHSLYVGFQAQEDRLRNQMVEAQRSSYSECMALRGHTRRGGVERVRR